MKKVKTITRKHNIFYHYICEHCGKDSGKVCSLIEVSSGSYSGAENAMKTRLYELKQNTSHGEYHDDYFNGKCPHCQKYQSWSGGSYLKYTIGTSILLTFCAAFFEFIGLMVVMVLTDRYPFDIHPLVGKVCLALLIAAFVIGLISTNRKWFDMKKDSKHIVRKTVPEIDWNDGTPNPMKKEKMIDQDMKNYASVTESEITPERIAERHHVSTDDVRIGQTPNGGVYVVALRSGSHVSFIEYDENHKELFRTTGFLGER